MPFNSSSSAMRNTATLAGILGFGLVTGALLAETSLMSFRLSTPTLFRPRSRSLDAVNDYLRPASTALQTSRRASPRAVPQGHHTGL